ncbi:universal stress protein [Chloroflexota bacterium]
MSSIFLTSYIIRPCDRNSYEMLPVDSFQNGGDLFTIMGQSLTNLRTSHSNDIDLQRSITAPLAKEGVNPESVVASGKPAEQVVNFAKRNSIDLIVVATHGRSGVSRRLYGSIAEMVMRTSPVPILMAMPPA